MIAAEFSITWAGNAGARWTLTMRDITVNSVLTRHRWALRYLKAGDVAGLVGDESAPECEDTDALGDTPAATVEIVGQVAGQESRLVFHHDLMREALIRATVVSDMLPLAGQPTGAGPARTQPPTGEGVVSVDHPRREETGGFIRMSSVLTTGEVDNVKCDFYADNPRLKKPVLYAPADLVRRFVEERYPAGGVDLEFLNAVGVRGGQGWVVGWQQSSKLSDKGNPYRDVVAIWRSEDDWRKGR